MSKKLLKIVRSMVPASVFNYLSPTYHKFMVFWGAVFYRFPSRKIFVLGVTGTKGKTTVLEIVDAILEEAGIKTALMSTLRFKIGDESERNMLKMTMPGRLANQKFLRRAVNEKCQYALMEMTSEGAVQDRHKHIEIDAMIFTNLSKEHIEAHGSFEKYREAKLKLFEAFHSSNKKNKVSVINADDENAKYFAIFKADQMWFYGLDKSSDISDRVLKTLSVANYKFNKYGMEFELGGLDIKSKLFGKFNLYNILSAVSFARSQNIKWDVIKRAIEKFPGIPGRVEFVDEGQDFKIIVDYAHTPDSLEKLYETFKEYNKICVLGSAGGGRDKWKRSEMGRIASENCKELILTDEDPYDENPKDIVNDISKGIKSPFKYRIVLNRRDAIQEALRRATEDDIVLITGKGTDPYIMGPNGEKVLWDDCKVVKQELKKLRLR